MTAKQFLDKVSRVDVYTASTVAIQNTTSTYVDLQKDQLFAGLDKSGLPVEPPYSPVTVAIKKRKGQPYDRVTRKDTGSYYAGIGIEVTADVVIVESTDKKAPDLNKKYGGLGLTPDSRTEYIRTLRPELLKVVKQQMK